MSKRFVIGLVVAFVAMFIALFVLSYNSRRNLVNSDRIFCVRVSKDRHAAAQAWYAAYAARLDQAKATTDPKLRTVYLQSAAQYLISSKTLNQNSELPVTWPPGTGQHPIGPGGLNCNTLYPNASAFAVLG